MIQQPWLHHYPASMPHTIDVEKYQSVVHFIEESFAKYKYLPMCESMGQILTYNEVDKLSKYFAAYMQHINLPIGTRIAIQLPNILQYPIATLGALRAGLVVVNINPLYTPREIAYQMKDAGAQAIVILENFAHNLMEVVKEINIQTIIIAKIGDMLGSIKGKVLNFAVKHIKRLIPPYDLPRTITFKEVLSRGQKVIFTPVTLTASDLAFLQYTGGTTGVSKGAMLTHRNLTANFQQVGALLQIHLQKCVERTAIPLPLYHIFGLAYLFVMAHLGAQSSLIANPRDIPQLVKILKRIKPTCFMGINTLFEKLLHHADFKKLDFTNLKITFSGGMQTHEEIKQQWEKCTNSRLLEAYGLTECAPGVSATMVHNSYIPFPNTSVVIADGQGNELPYGTKGELLVKGPQVMQGYWEKPLENKETFINGWFKTGDIAIMNTKGGISIVDRQKDMINISGFNVYPNEIEQVLRDHPKVLEVGAIGIAELSLKEAVKVFIVKKDITLTAEEIIAYCKNRMAKYKVPKYVEFRKNLPKSPIGKVLRRLLKE